MGNSPSKTSPSKIDKSKTEEMINLLIIGKTGVGKSSTANTILGTKGKFKSKQSATAVTRKCQHVYGKQQGRKIKVVDMPGWANASLTPAKATQIVIDSAVNAMAKTPTGYNAFLMTMAMGRFTHEDKLTVDCMKAIFGKEFIKQFGILVITHGDLFDKDESDCETFEQWCSKQEGDFKTLIQECGGRVVLFQNKANDENIRTKQLEKLFTMIDKLRHDGGYTPALFEAARSERERFSLEQNVPEITEDIKRRTEKILDKLNSSSFAGDVTKLTKLKGEVDKLFSQIQSKDNGTGILSSVIETIKLAQAVIKAAIEVLIQEGLESQQRAQEMFTKAKSLFGKLKEYIEENEDAIKKGLLITGVCIGISAVIASIFVIGFVTVPAGIAASAASGVAATTIAAETAVAATGVAGAVTAGVAVETAAVATVAGTATAVATGAAGLTPVAVAAISGTASGVAIVGGSGTSIASGVLYKKSRLSSNCANAANDTEVIGREVPETTSSMQLEEVFFDIG